jgi:hypothetical protein
MYTSDLATECVGKLVDVGLHPVMTGFISVSVRLEEYESLTH